MVQNSLTSQHKLFTAPHLGSDWARKLKSERSVARELIEQYGASEGVSSVGNWPSTHVPILVCSEPWWSGKGERESSMGGNCTQLTRSYHGHKPLSHGFGIEWVSKRVNKWAQQSAQAKGVGRSQRMNERCEQTSEQANGQANGPVLRSVFLVVLHHSGESKWRK